MNQTETNNSGNGKRTAFVEKLLKSYFHFRDNLPREGYIQEYKTTVQIQDDLSQMCSVTADEIIDYMVEREYSTTTEPDGTVAWAIWRKI